MTTSNKIDISRLRVTKKLSPISRGAIKLANQFGESLVCVRHRMDDKGTLRYTTVELLVETTKVQPRVDATVGIRIGINEKSLQTVVRAAGATWDRKAAVWRIPRRVAGILKLTDRIVEN